MKETIEEVIKDLFGREVLEVEVTLRAKAYSTLGRQLVFEVSASKMSDVSLEARGSILPYSCEVRSMTQHTLSEAPVEVTVALQIKCDLLYGPESDRVIAAFMSGPLERLV